MQWIRSHLSFANSISLIALFVALGGTSLAAVSLTKNSVGAKQIKKNAVGASEIKKDAVRASEIKSSAVGASELRSNAVASGDIADNGVGAADLSDNSVGAGELADNSVGSGELTDNSIAGADVANGSLGLGDLADEATGPRAFARVRSDGTLETEIEGQTPPGPSQHRGVEQADVQKNPGAPGGDGQTTGPGVYCFGGLDFTPRSAVVSLDNSDSLPALPGVTGGTTNFTTSVALKKGPDLGRCDAAHGQLRVALTRVNEAAAPELADHGFTIWIYG